MPRQQIRRDGPAKMHWGLTRPLAIALGVFWLVMVVIATVAAHKGERYRYPLTIRLLS